MDRHDLKDYYDIDVEEAECLSEHLTAAVLTDEVRQYAMEFDSEWSTSTCRTGAWWRCGDEGEGWITDEADVEIAAA